VFCRGRSQKSPNGSKYQFTLKLWRLRVLSCPRCATDVFLVPQAKDCKSTRRGFGMGPSMPRGTTLPNLAYVCVIFFWVLEFWHMLSVPAEPSGAQKSMTRLMRRGSFFRVYLSFINVFLSLVGLCKLSNFH